MKIADDCICSDVNIRVAGNAVTPEEKQNMSTVDVNVAKEKGR